MIEGLQVTSMALPNYVQVWHPDGRSLYVSVTEVLAILINESDDVKQILLERFVEGGQL